MCLASSSDEVDEVDTLIPIVQSENENKIINRKTAPTSPTLSTKKQVNIDEVFKNTSYNSVGETFTNPNVLTEAIRHHLYNENSEKTSHR